MPPSGSAESGWRNENECCLNMHPIPCGWTRTALYAFHGTIGGVKRFPKIAILRNVRTGVEPALDSFGILPATVYVMSPFSEGCQLSVLPIEHTAHHALIIGSVRKAKASYGTDIAVQFFLWYA